jgi:hypothetical protein
MWAGVYASESGGGRSAADTRSAVSPCKSRRASPTARRSMRSRPRWTTSSSTAARRWSWTRGPSKCCGSGCPWSPSSTTTTPATPPRRYGSWRKVGRVGDPLRRPPAQGLGRQPDLGRGAGAVGADVGVADVLAARAFGPGLPQSTPAGPVGGVGLAPVNHRAFSLASPSGRGRMLGADTGLPEVRASWTRWPRTSARVASRCGPRWLPYAPAPRHDGPVRGGAPSGPSSS